MPDYRLYCLDGDGQIGLADWVEALTDEEAMARAQKLRPDAQRCELWLSNRLVAKLNGARRFERSPPRKNTSGD